MVKFDLFESHCVQVMKIRKRVLGGEHIYTLTSMESLASTYSKQGQWQEAEELMVQVIQTRKGILGEEHPDTLSVIADLAVMYGKQGQWKEAEDLYVQVLHSSQRVLGKEHPDRPWEAHPNVYPSKNPKSGLKNLIFQG